MKPKPLNTFTRWGRIFSPSFVKEQVIGQPAGGPWKFWFLWNTVVALIVTGMCVWVVRELFDTSEQYFSTVLPHFELDVESGTMSSNAEPIRFSVIEYFTEKFPDDPEPQVGSGEDFVIFFDMDGALYNTANLEDYDVSLLFTAQGVEAFARDDGIVHRFAYKDLLPHLGLPPDEQTIDRSTLRELWMTEVRDHVLFYFGLFGFFFAWFWTCISRLVAVLFWSIVGWIQGKIMDCEAFNFDVSFLSMLYFGVPLGLIQFILFFNGVNSLLIFFFSLLLVVGLLGINIREIKTGKKKKKKH